MEKKAYIMRNQMEARLSSIRTSSMRLNDVPEGEGIVELLDKRYLPILFSNNLIHYDSLESILQNELYQTLIDVRLIITNKDHTGVWICYSKDMECVDLMGGFCPEISKDDLDISVNTFLLDSLLYNLCHQISQFNGDMTYQGFHYNERAHCREERIDWITDLLIRKGFDLSFDQMKHYMHRLYYRYGNHYNTWFTLFYIVETDSIPITQFPSKVFSINGRRLPQSKPDIASGMIWLRKDEFIMMERSSNRDRSNYFHSPVSYRNDVRVDSDSYVILRDLFHSNTI